MCNVIFSFQEAALRVRQHWIFQNLNWEMTAGQNWVILGRNGAGKSTLIRALVGDVPVVAGRFYNRFAGRVADSIGYVSLELQQQFIAREDARDDARYFSDQLDRVTTVAESVMSAADPAAANSLGQTLERLGIGELSERPIRALSNGEMRKVLIARALLKAPQLLILDEPFEGLDSGSRERLRDWIDRLMRDGLQVIQTTQKQVEILPRMTHVLSLEDCRIVWAGERTEILPAASADRQGAAPRVAAEVDPPDRPPESPPAGDDLVRMRDVTIRYGQHTVLQGVNWTIAKGENWAVWGPNGAGKTTLLEMIFGEHPQAFSNEVFLFGRRRGSGESIWDIKQKVGYISPEFQVQYRKRMRVSDVVISGWFDSIGLYRTATAEQRRAGERWIERMGLAPLAQAWFDRLSYGQRRMILLARAMVKAPELLVLDEPCQGLDLQNRRHLLHLVDVIGRETATQILCVTHAHNEIPACVEKLLELVRPTAGEPYEARVRRLMAQNA